MPKPFRILYVHNSTLIGGGNRVLLGLLEKLDRNRFEPWSLIPTEGPMVEALKERGIPYLIEDVISCVSEGSLSSKFTAIAKLAIKLLPKQFHLVHAQSPLTYKIPSMVLQYGSTRRLCHFHFPSEGEESSHLDWAFQVKPHNLLACSENVGAGYRPALEKISLNLPIQVVVNFADTDRFSPGPPPMELINNFKLSSASHIITICGQVSERKGHPDFLQMAQQLISRFPAAKFLIAGEDILTRGDYQRKMERLASDLGIEDHVCFLGYQEDVPGIIRASDVILLPSSAEGMPLSLIEAAACGKPVVAYDIPGVNEIVINGKTGNSRAPRSC